MIDNTAYLNELISKGQLLEHEVVTYDLFTLPLAQEWLSAVKEIISPRNLTAEELAFAEGQRQLIKSIECIIKKINTKLESEECLNYRTQLQPMPHELKQKSQNP